MVFFTLQGSQGEQEAIANLMHGRTCLVVAHRLTTARTADQIVVLNSGILVENGIVVICAGGTGNPFFTTDTAAALRAIEIGADIVLKATKVDGVYSADPVRDANAELFDTLAYDRVIESKLGVMDANAIVLCRDQGMPIRVFNVFDEGNLLRIARGEEIGTLVS